MSKTIPFFDYRSLFQENEEQLLQVFSDVSKRGAFIMQDDLSLFEDRLCNYTGSKYAIGVANATNALELLLKAGGIGQGDEVIFCSHTMVATASAIKFTGATPVPVEAGSDHIIDADSIKGAITENTRAIMPTQLNGRVADMEAIAMIAKEYNLQIYEDSAQALGAQFQEQSAGTFGVGGCISFYPAKILGCFGDGGVALTNHLEIYEKIKLFRDHGRAADGNVSVWGYNSRLDNLQAAILNYFFDSLDQTIERRRAIASLYHNKLKDLSMVQLPPPPLGNSDHFDVFQNYEIEADSRDELRSYLDNKGIGTLIQWGGKAVHEFKDLGFSQSLPFTEQMMKRNLMLPLNMSVTDDEIDYICDCIIKFFG